MEGKQMLEKLGWLSRQMILLTLVYLLELAILTIFSFGRVDTFEVPLLDVLAPIPTPETMIFNTVAIPLYSCSYIFFIMFRWLGLLGKTREESKNNEVYLAWFCLMMITFMSIRTATVLT